jgi:hypothetical protein
MTTAPRKALLLLPIAPLVAGVAAPAAARTTITPYIEVQQVFTADLTGHDQDAVTYTGAAAGVDITLDSQRLHGQIDYRYDHYFSWSNKYRDTDIQNGLATIVYQPTPEISLNAGGIATRARGTLGQQTPGFLVGNLDNTTQVYAVEAGPSYAGHLGDLSLNADYRFGWTKSTDGQGDYDLGPGQPVLQNNFTTTDQVVDAAIGMAPGAGSLPFGWQVSGGWNQDNVHFLDARLRDYFGRADITVPVSDTLALEAGAGYENDRASQAAILTDADGNAILTKKRHLQADKSKPRELSYDEDGLIWDVGVLWRPSARTTLEVRGGQRYGQTVITGRFSDQITPNSSVQVVAYDDIESFGRQLTSEVGALPTSFSSFAPSIPTTLSGCVFGTNGGQGACIPALQSVNSNFYRSRGVYANYSTSHGPWIFGLGANYENRHYLTPEDGPQVIDFSHQTDQSVTVDGVVVRKLSPVSSLTLNALAAWYDSSAFDSHSYYSYGGAATYNRYFSNHLSGTASLGIFSGSGENSGDDVIGTGLVSLRYQL